MENLIPEEEIALLHERIFCSDMLTERHLNSMQKVREQDKTDIFLSHSSKDMAFSRAIATDLMDAGFSVFLDEWRAGYKKIHFFAVSAGRAHRRLCYLISQTKVAVSLTSIS